MGYATFADVTARAGALGQAWHDGSDPSRADVERIIDQVAAEIDGLIAGSGFTLPLGDQTAIDSLVSINADKALLVALDATYVGDASHVNDFRSSVQKRVDAYDNAIAAKDIAAVFYLGSTAAGAQEGGAADFWTVDGANDYYWSLYGGRLGSWPWSLDPFGLSPSQGPGFRKGMSL